jgi:hypothetical protein
VQGRSRILDFNLFIKVHSQTRAVKSIVHGWSIHSKPMDFLQQFTVHGLYHTNFLICVCSALKQHRSNIHLHVAPDEAEEQRTKSEFGLSRELYVILSWQL